MSSRRLSISSGATGSWMADFFSKLCEPEHLVIVVLVLIIALILTSAGTGLGGVISAFLKKILGDKDVNINLGGAAVAKSVPKECEGCGLIVDPTKCVMHQSEHERSKRNEAQIASLWEEYGKLRNESLAAAAKLKDEMTQGFEKVNASIADSNKTILSALAGTRNGYHEPSRGGRE